MRIETFEQFINFGNGRQFLVSKLGVNNRVSNNFKSWMEEKYQQLDIRFEESVSVLSEESIFILCEQDNGPLNNVVSGISKHCFGVRLFEEKSEVLVEMFYVNNEFGLAGELIRLNIEDSNYFELLLRFTSDLSQKYRDVDAIAAFNTFQTKLRGFLEKLGFFTVTTSELKPYFGENAFMVGGSKRGIKYIPIIDHTDFYRQFFNNTFELQIESGVDYVYLMVNCDSGSIKIGTSSNPKFREKTLQSQEPNITIVALWKCDKGVEKQLHEKFRSKRIRGEWFNLNFVELSELRNSMSEYN